MLVEKDPCSGLLRLAPSPTLRGLHAKQRAAIAGIRRFRAWLAGRRSGKTYAAAVWLLGGAAGQISAYCARTLKSAKAIMLGIFAELNEKFSLNLIIRASTGTIIEQSGHVIQFYGIRDVSQADLMRGQKFRRVFLDEGGAFTDELLQYAIEKVIQPTLMDLQGHLTLGGTPGPIPKGYFFDITGNPGLQIPTKGRWPTHYWTFRDNPHMPREAVLEEALEVNNWTEQSPGFRQEYDAIWCENSDAIIYRYTGAQWAPVPESGNTVMGIDFGTVDATTWSVGRQPYNARPHVFVLEAIAKDHITDNINLNHIVAITQQLRAKWSVNVIRCDEGGLGKALANEMRLLNIPVQQAHKADKRGRIDGARGRLAAGTMHLCADAKPLYDEWLSLCWNEKRDDHHERQADDISDATLYMLEEFPAYESPPTKAEDTTLADAIRAHAMAKANRRNGNGSMLFADELPLAA